METWTDYNFFLVKRTDHNYKHDYILLLTTRRYVNCYELKFHTYELETYTEIYFLFYLQLSCGYYMNISEQVGLSTEKMYKLVLIIFFQSRGCECSETCSMRLKHVLGHFPPYFSFSTLNIILE